MFSLTYNYSSFLFLQVSMYFQSSYYKTINKFGMFEFKVLQLNIIYVYVKYVSVVQLLIDINVRVIPQMFYFYIQQFKDVRVH